MEATELLSNEHKDILLALDIMNRICQVLTKDPANVAPGIAEDLAKLHEFLIVFADKSHHGKEENVLFKAMNEAGLPMDEGPLGVMLYEHDEGRSYIRGMGEGLSQMKSQPKTACEQFVQNARSYSQLLSQHIDKEDHILYPMANNCLNPADDCVMLDNFASIEKEHLGAKKQVFKQMLADLKQKYL